MDEEVEPSVRLVVAQNITACIEPLLCSRAQTVGGGHAPCPRPSPSRQAMADTTQHDGGKEENARRRGSASIFGSSSSCTAAVPAPLLHPSLYLLGSEQEECFFVIHAYEVLDETPSRASLEIEALICGSRHAAWPCLATRSALSMAALTRTVCGLVDIGPRERCGGGVGRRGHSRVGLGGWEVLHHQWQRQVLVFVVSYCCSCYV